MLPRPVRAGAPAACASRASSPAHGRTTTTMARRQASPSAASCAVNACGRFLGPRPFHSARYTAASRVSILPSPPNWATRRARDRRAPVARSRIVRSAASSQHVAVAPVRPACGLAPPYDTPQSNHHRRTRQLDDGGAALDESSRLALRLVLAEQAARARHGPLLATRRGVAASSERERLLLRIR